MLPRFNGWFTRQLLTHPAPVILLCTAFGFAVSGLIFHTLLAGKIGAASSAGGMVGQWWKARRHAQASSVE